MGKHSGDYFRGFFLHHTIAFLIKRVPPPQNQMLFANIVFKGNLLWLFLVSSQNSSVRIFEACGVADAIFNFNAFNYSISVHLSRCLGF